MAHIGKAHTTSNEDEGDDAVTDEYGEAIAGISGRVSWWRFGEAAGTGLAIDEEGTQNGTYQGAVALGQIALPRATDNPDLRLDGSGFVEVTDHARFHIAEGTIVGWFSVDDLTATRTILSKDTGGLAAGDFIFWYVASLNRLRFQLEDATNGLPC